MSRILLGLALRLTVLVTSAIVISALLAGSAHASPDGGRLTVVLVHGAWADNSSWDGEVAALQAHGYEVRAIANPLRNLTTDAESVADFLRTIRGPSCWSGIPTAAR